MYGVCPPEHTRVPTINTHPVLITTQSNYVEHGAACGALEFAYYTQVISETVGPVAQYMSILYISIYSLTQIVFHNHDDASFIYLSSSIHRKHFTYMCHTRSCMKYLPKSLMYVHAASLCFHGAGHEGL